MYLPDLLLIKHCRKLDDVGAHFLILPSAETGVRREDIRAVESQVELENWKKLELNFNKCKSCSIFACLLGEKSCVLGPAGIEASQVVLWQQAISLLAVGRTLYIINQPWGDTRYGIVIVRAVQSYLLLSCATIMF